MELPKQCTDLQSARRGRCRRHLGKPTQRYTLFKNIYTFVTIFIFSVSVVFFKQKRRRFLVRAQCFCYQHFSLFIPALTTSNLSGHNCTKTLILLKEGPVFQPVYFIDQCFLREQCTCAFLLQF